MNFNHRKVPIFSLVLLFFITSCKNDSTSTDGGDLDGWELTFSDEFDGTGIPSSKWKVQEYNRRPNETGPDGWWDKNSVYQNGEGQLVIRVDQIPNRNNDNDEFDYTTGMVRSKGRFEQTFGRFEIRCKLPEKSGWWVAFWLMSESVGNVDGSGEDGTEIDIMEAFGWTDRINHALHWDGYGEAHQVEGHDTVIDGIRDGYHTYVLEWTEDEYKFFVDDVLTWKSSAGGVSKVPAYVKISGELSSEDWAQGSWWANPIDGSSYPDFFLVDYVRVYKKLE